MRKGQGLSVNMMILLVLGVVVLIVASYMLISKVRSADKTTSSCEQLGGLCEPCTKDANGNCNACANGKFFGTCQDATKQCCSRPDSQNTQT